MTDHSERGSCSYSVDPDNVSELDFRPHPEEERGPICPTCNGHGMVDKNKSGAIALIPVSDSRLKPRRTKLYVAIAIIVSLLICIPVAFFVYERSVTLSLTQAEIVEYNISPEDVMNASMTMKIRVSVKNENYFALSTKNLTLIVQNPQVIGECQMPGHSSVSSRTTDDFHCVATLNLTVGDAKLINKVCQRNATWRHFTFMFSASLEWKYLTLDSGVLKQTDWSCFTCLPHYLPNIGSKTSCLKNSTNGGGMQPINPNTHTMIA